MDNAAPANLMSLDEWKKQARAGSAPADAVLRKQYIVDGVKALGDGKYQFTISTGSPDRDHDTIAPAGWDLENYRKNPIVLWGHNYYSMDAVLGKAEWIGIEAGVLKARAEFATEVNPMAKMAVGLLDFGALRSTSVGFRPKKTVYNDERGGYDFLEQELLEFSIVPVPANPEALLDAKAAGIDLAPLKGWAERVLGDLEPGLWVPRQAAERVLKIAAIDPSAALTLEDLSGLVRARLEKSGRTLSAANEERIRSARNAGDVICAALDEILAQVEQDDEKAIKPPAPAGYIPSQEQARAVISTALSEAAGAVLRRAQGRLD